MANYTINEIPDTATEVGNSDLAVVWQNNATKKISILNFFKNLVKKSEVTNTISTTSENPITAKAVSSLLTISASSATITNAPPLQNGTTIRFFFTSQITGSDDMTALAISYNGTSYSVKATANGTLKDFTAYPVATEQTRNLAKGEKSEEEKGETRGKTKSGTRATVTTYVYCQAYTTLEMMFDGTKFIIMGNPVVISNSDYTVYADGSITQHFSRIIETPFNEEINGFYLSEKFLIDLPIAFRNGIRYYNYSVKSVMGVSPQVMVIYPNGYSSTNSQIAISFLCPFRYEGNVQFEVQFFAVGY